MSPDPWTEMQFALAEGQASDVEPSTRSRILAAAFGQRRPGFAIGAVEEITGLDTFDRASARLEALLGELDSSEWRKPVLRDLDVQQLVGHLIGVESHFHDALGGAPSPGDADHVESTHAAAQAQTGREPSDTVTEWTSAVATTKALVGSNGRDLSAPVRMHGIALGLDDFLVVRSFELWTHDGDIRRATGRDPADPDDVVLARMTDLAAVLLPAGMALSGGGGVGSVRLVLTGAGGGAWDVDLTGQVQRAAAGRHFDSHVTLDAAAFCRVVANRSTFEDSAPVVAGGEDPARILFAAATLALD